MREMLGKREECWNACRNLRKNEEISEKREEEVWFEVGSLFVWLV